MPYKNHEDKLRHQREYAIEHKDEERLRGKNWRTNHPDYGKKYSKTWRKKNPDSWKASGKKYRIKNKAKLYFLNKRRQNKVRLDVIKYYSNGSYSCSCCNEKLVDLLVIDHVDGRVKHGHDKTITGHKLYLLLIKKGYPEGFSVLCQNCNYSKFRNNGKCIHELKQMIVEHENKTISRVKLREKLKRLEVLTFYSNGVMQCSCCGELESELLVLDHIIPRKMLGHDKSYVSSRLYAWIIKNNYPIGFQVLCHNCNMAKERLGQCVHKQNKQYFLNMNDEKTKIVNVEEKWPWGR